MKRKIPWILLSSLMVAVLVLTSCQPASVEQATEGQTVIGQVTEVPKSTAGDEVAVIKEEPTEAITTTSGPQYGGVINLLIAAEPGQRADPYYYENGISSAAHEELAHGDWTKGGAGTNEWNFMGSYYPEEYHNAGMLAESWEVPDNETIIFYLRKGIRWQDRPPVNGREFVAADVVYSFNRNWGLGDGFTEKSPHFANEQYETITSVTAIDKYTVEFKHSPPNVAFVPEFFGPGVADVIVAREAVEQEGGYEDWMKLVGTGAWMIDDYVPDSAFVFRGNPNYWGYDELHPENQLPYADTLKYLVIPDPSTQLAALRAGKVAVLGMTWETAAQVAKSHPDLVQGSYAGTGLTIMMRYGVEPFNDIRVRRALQMSVNLDELSATYYGGMSTPPPLPLLAVPGFYTPMDELSQEIQDAYTYNPEGAKALLAEAGYPNGFETKIYINSATTTSDLALIIKDYFSVIGVDLEIAPKENAAYYGMLYGLDMDGMCFWSGGWMAVPVGVLTWYVPGRWWNVGQIDNEHYSDLITQAMAATELDEWRRLLKQANDYSFEQNWAVNMIPVRSYQAWQPWIGGYNGEHALGAFRGADIWARIWIDQDMKEAMGN